MGGKKPKARSARKSRAQQVYLTSHDGLFAAHALHGLPHNTWVYAVTFAQAKARIDERKQKRGIGGTIYKIVPVMKIKGTLKGEFQKSRDVLSKSEQRRRVNMGKPRVAKKVKFVTKKQMTTGKPWSGYIKPAKGQKTQHWAWGSGRKP